MNAISLFSGIGGLDIGFSAAGFNIIAQVEIDKFCQSILKRHAPEWWPNANHFADVREFGRASIAGAIAVIFGGFPCQPHSTAGKRKGAEDSRDLWPEFRRVIGEIRPRCVLLENVPGIISTGYAAIVAGDLAALGYDAQWGIISAADAGAPHKRERWFCVAYAYSHRQLQQSRSIPNFRRWVILQGNQMGDAQSARLPERRTQPGIDTSADEKAKDGKPVYRSHRAGGYRQQRQRWVAQSPLGRTTHGIPRWLDKPRWPAYQGEAQHSYEPPRTVAKSQAHRASRVKALGNTVLP